VLEDSAGVWEISINTATPAAARAGLSPANTATASNLAVLQSMFLVGGNGRIVRLRKKGKDYYAVASSVAATTGPIDALALVTLASAPGLVHVGGGGVQCGIRGDGKDMDVSVIDLVRYNLRSMVNDTAYTALFTASGLGTGGGASALPYESKRAELVRVELTPAGVEIPSTRELVGEYAVDLQLRAWRATDALTPTLIPVVDEVNDTYASTQLLRGMHVRFSVRSREADRERDIPTGTGGGGSNDHYRIGLRSPEGTVACTAGPNCVFARVRTFQSDIPLRNMEGSNW
jgi:hypothetical protein